MKIFLPIVSASFFIILLSQLSLAQSLSRSVIGSAGATMKSAEYSLQYNVGELMIQSFSTAQSTLSQGFEQPSDKKPEPAPAPKNTESSVLIYPLPAIDYVRVKYLAGPSLGQPAVFKLYDSEGKIARKYDLGSDENTSEFELSLSGMAIGTYVLEYPNTILNKSIPIKSFQKIVIY